MAAIGPVSGALKAWHEEQKAQFARLLRTGVVGIRFGQRIRNLRILLGWSQRRAARHLGVSVRTVIRHERGESWRPWLPLLLEVRALEDDHAEEIIALLVHSERNEQRAGGDANIGNAEHRCRFCCRQLVS